MSEHGRVFFVEDFHSIDQRLRDAWDGGLEVWNAPRPLLSEDGGWEGDFRHGIFYVVLPPLAECDRYQAGYRERNIRMDASLCVLVSRETIEAHRAALAAEYPDADVNALSYEDVVINWIDQEQE